MGRRRRVAAQLRARLPGVTNDVPVDVMRVVLQMVAYVSATAEEEEGDGKSSTDDGSTSPVAAENGEHIHDATTTSLNRCAAVHEKPTTSASFGLAAALGVPSPTVSVPPPEQPSHTTLEVVGTSPRSETSSPSKLPTTSPPVGAAPGTAMSPLGRSYRVAAASGQGAPAVLGQLPRGHLSHRRARRGLCKHNVRANPGYEELMEQFFTMRLRQMERVQNNDRWCVGCGSGHDDGICLTFWAACARGLSVLTRVLESDLGDLQGWSLASQHIACVLREYRQLAGTSLVGWCWHRISCIWVAVIVLTRCVVIVFLFVCRLSAMDKFEELQSGKRVLVLHNTVRLRVKCLSLIRWRTVIPSA